MQWSIALLIMATDSTVLIHGDRCSPDSPGSTVTVEDVTSIYNGYTGFVQRISGDRAAVLFEGGNWDKLVTLRLRDLNPLTDMAAPRACVPD